MRLQRHTCESWIISSRYQKSLTFSFGVVRQPYVATTVLVWKGSLMRSSITKISCKWSKKNGKWIDNQQLSIHLTISSHPGYVQLKSQRLEQALIWVKWAYETTTFPHRNLPLPWIQAFETMLYFTAGNSWQPMNENQRLFSLLTWRTPLHSATIFAPTA